MLTILIMLFLAISFYTGYQRGLMLQLVYSAGYALSFILAKSFYKPLGKKLELLIPYPAPTPKTELVLFDNSLIFDLDKAFYAGFAFVIILFFGWLITRFIGMLCYGLTFMPLLKQGNDTVGGLLNSLITFIGLVIILTLIAMVPLDIIQNLFRKSSLAKWLVDSTPLISNWLNDWWITKIIL